MHVMHAQRRGDLPDGNNHLRGQPVASALLCNKAETILNIAEAIHCSPKSHTAHSVLLAPSLFSILHGIFIPMTKARINEVMVGTPVEGMVHASCITFSKLTAFEHARSSKPIPVVHIKHNVGQATCSSYDRDGAVPHVDHLHEATGLKAAEDEEHVTAGIGEQEVSSWANHSRARLGYCHPKFPAKARDSPCKATLHQPKAMAEQRSGQEARVTVS